MSPNTIFRESGHFDTKSFRYKSKSIRYSCKVDSIQTHVTSSHFGTEYYTIHKWPNEPNEPLKTYSLEQIQTSVVNKTNLYLHTSGKSQLPPNLPSSPPIGHKVFSFWARGNRVVQLGQLSRGETGNYNVDRSNWVEFELICWIENNKLPHILKTKTNIYTELFIYRNNFSLYQIKFTFVTNRLWLVSKRLELKRLCIETTVNHF